MSKRVYRNRAGDMTKKEARAAFPLGAIVYNHRAGELGTVVGYKNAHQWDNKWANVMVRRGDLSIKKRWTADLELKP